MKFANIVREGEMIPNGLSFAYHVYASEDAFMLKRYREVEKKTHLAIVFLRFGAFRLSWQIHWDWTVKLPRCPRCHTAVARAGTCLVCLATIPLQEAYKDVPFYDPARLPKTGFPVDKAALLADSKRPPTVAALVVLAALIWLMVLAFLAVDLFRVFGEMKFERGTWRQVEARKAIGIRFATLYEPIGAEASTGHHDPKSCAACKSGGPV